MVGLGFPNHQRKLSKIKALNSAQNILIVMEKDFIKSPFIIHSSSTTLLEVVVFIFYFNTYVMLQCGIRLKGPKWLKFDTFKEYNSAVIFMVHDRREECFCIGLIWNTEVCQ